MATMTTRHKKKFIYKRKKKNCHVINFFLLFFFKFLKCSEKEKERQVALRVVGICET